MSHTHTHTHNIVYNQHHLFEFIPLLKKLEHRKLKNKNKNKSWLENEKILNVQFSYLSSTVKQMLFVYRVNHVGTGRHRKLKRRAAFSCFVIRNFHLFK